MKIQDDIIDMRLAASQNEQGNYNNLPLTPVNDHVIRLSVMTEAYFWHYHPNSDETFQVLEGSIYIDLDGRTVDLKPGQLFTIPQNVVHRTRPKGGRSVNITFEKADMKTVKCDAPTY